MILRVRIGRWRFTFTVAPVTDVIGVNSKLDSGGHILMWDFDDTTLSRVRSELEHVQRVYDLPNIYILETKARQNYIAYCFKRVPWQKAVEIAAFTHGLDYNFFRYGVYREYFTLRVTPKNNRRPRLVWIIKSDRAEDALITDLKQWVQYETLTDDAPMGMIKIG